ncbi:Zinc finger protein 888, partial [Stegodyphus mimosarum]
MHPRGNRKSNLWTPFLVKRFTCRFCSKGFRRESHLEEHLLIHTGEKPFKCELCEESFKHDQSLKYHICLNPYAVSTCLPYGDC